MGYIWVFSPLRCRWMSYWHCRPVLRLATVPSMGHYYRFKRGDRVSILWGRLKGVTAVVDSAVLHLRGWDKRQRDFEAPSNKGLRH